MKKLAFLLIALLVISGCGSVSDTPETKVSEVEAPKKEMSEIALLQRDIEAIDAEIARLLKKSGISTESSAGLSGSDAEAYEKVSLLRQDRGELIKKLSALKESSQ